MDDVNLLALAMGLFGVAEILNHLGPVKVQNVSLRALIPNRQEWRDSAMPTLRGSLLGAGIGTLPGTGAPSPPS